MDRLDGMALPGQELRTMHLFAGAGGGILADIILGHRPVCAVEYASYPRSVLLARQRDGLLPRFPIWDDVCTFDGRPWRGRVDVVAGGFPCQDISSAGKGAGLDGAKSGLWSEMARIIGEVRPRFAFVENYPMLTSRGLGVVLGDLAAMGYDAQWGVLGARDAGAPHKRDRIWIFASDANRKRRRKEQEPGAERQDSTKLGNDGSKRYVAYPDMSGCQEQRITISDEEKLSAPKCGGWWSSEPCVGRLADGVPDRVDRLRAIGNGQVPHCAAMAWWILTDMLTG